MRNPLSGIIDITPLISEDLAVWPGDRPFRRALSRSFEEGENLVLSSITTTLHLGAHADAPIHYHPEGEGIESRGLDFYMGPCQVISFKKPPGERIFPEDFPGGRPSVKAPRVLIKTGSFPDPHSWRDDFNALSPELIGVLFDQGVILVGIDTPSVDLAFDQKLLAHKAIYKHDMAILEGLVLTKAPEGLYDLLALPLPIKGGDSSPVRAILKKKKEGP